MLVFDDVENNTALIDIFAVLQLTRSFVRAFDEVALTFFAIIKPYAAKSVLDRVGDIVSVVFVRLFVVFS